MRYVKNIRAASHRFKLSSLGLPKSGGVGSIPRELPRNLALRTRSHKASADATLADDPDMLASHPFPSTLPYILLFTHYPSVEVLFIAPPSSPRLTLSATAVVPSALLLPLIGLHEGRKRCLSVEPSRARYFRLRPSRQKGSDGPDRKVSILSAQPL
jgi:hypothetical protein